MTARAQQLRELIARRKQGMSENATAPRDDSPERADRPADVWGRSQNTGSGPGRYRVLRLHGEGGLGKVFVALDADLHREVALKTVRSRHLDSRESQRRFLQEAEITAGLEHPGIVPIYGLGSDEHGPPLLRHAIDQGLYPQGGD